jgi:uncharacterized protein YbjT (DUF2867 family)
VKVLVIEASGTTGRAVADAPAVRGHEVIRASRTCAVRIDLEDPATVHTVLDRIKDLDAVVTCAGHATWKPLAELNDIDFAFSFRCS